MKKSKNTNEVSETKSQYSCEFCKREFLRESTILKHICEYKHRWLEKDLPSNRLGFQSWMQFYKKNSNSRKHNTYEEYIRSAYYLAFTKFGKYCVEVNVLNVSRYVDWLLKNQIKIDNWNSDTTYNKYLVEYLKLEDAFDAIARSVQTTFDLSENEGIQARDMFRFGNPNKICYAITMGKISPWMLYCSTSGVQFLDTLNPDHVKMISDYINPEQWALKFHREPEVKKQIDDTLRQAGY